MADRLDLGEISRPPTKGDLDAIKSILQQQINQPIPNLVRHIYKVRRGKLTKIKLWQFANLGTCRTRDLFVTNNDNVLIPVNVVDVHTIDDSIEKIIEEHSISIESIDVTQEEQEEAIGALWSW